MVKKGRELNFHAKKYAVAPANQPLEWAFLFVLQICLPDLKTPDPEENILE